MKRPLSALFVEDREDDVRLILLELERAGFEVTGQRVDTAVDMRTALACKAWDCVLADYTMPRFGALEALEVLRASGQDLPFILVSGTIGEEAAVECLKAGAHDFLVKGRLARLVTAIEREMTSARNRAAQRESVRKNLDLELAREHAERVSAFKSQFLANMSHELRTPLNLIIGFSELLLGEKAGPLTTKQREFVGYVFTGGQHLLNLSNDALDLSSIEAGRIPLRLEWIDPVPIARSAVETARSLAEKQGVSLRLHLAPGSSCAVHVDPVRFRQILYNLLSNAIKFTPPGGEVRLHALQEDHRLVLRVVDTGVGIRPQDLSRLFREFERIESASGPKPEGTGLGLALTKRLVELLDGTIAVASEPGRGTTFTVEFPLQEQAQPVEP